jgi:hypothetical protein
MSVQLKIPEALYKRLQKHAVPFVDTPISVIEKWADHFEQVDSGGSSSAAELPTNEYSAKKLDPFHPPDLLHTRARGTFGESSFSNWNDLVRTAHIEAFKKAGSFGELRNATHAQIRNGSHSDSGFKFVAEINTSIQGVDANHAWQYSLKLAEYLGQRIHAVIEWRRKSKAAHPGQRAVIEWSPL